MSKMGPFADFGDRHLEARLTPQADIVSLATIQMWSEYRETGIDPLGVQTGSINKYQRLLPGLSNVALR